MPLATSLHSVQAPAPAVSLADLDGLRHTARRLRKQAEDALHAGDMRRFASDASRWGQLELLIRGAGAR